MEKKPLPKAIKAPAPQEDSIRIIEVSEIISIFTAKELGKERQVRKRQEDLREYA